MNHITIVIPAYEPDQRLLTLLNDMRDRSMAPVVIVDDGSGTHYTDIFDSVEEILKTLSSPEGSSTLLRHEVNRGKGAALKTAFRYLLERDPELYGVVTADSDGQHTPDCIMKVCEALLDHPDDLVLGTRDFDDTVVPWKSRLGNKLTSRVFGALTGIRVSDTQTGLRGLPARFMRTCLDLSGDRFEFETQMLAATDGVVGIDEVKIKTIYDSKTNHQTHYRTFADSARICKVLLREPVTFALSSVASSLIDISAFAVLSALLKDVAFHVAIATVVARLISATVNFKLNSRVVFKSDQSDAVAAPRYIALAATIMALSATMSQVGTAVLPAVPEVVVKVIVDAVLFALSYTVQKRSVF